MAIIVETLYKLKGEILRTKLVDKACTDQRREEGSN